jgi:hypothetical protein
MALIGDAMAGAASESNGLPQYTPGMGGSLGQLGGVDLRTGTNQRSGGPFGVPFTGTGFIDALDPMMQAASQTQQVRKNQVLISTGKDGDKYMDVEDANDRPWAWSKAWKKKQLARMSKVLGEPVNEFNDQFFATWQKAVQWAAAANRAGKNLTPYDALDLMAREKPGGVTLDKDGNAVSTTTARSVDNITEGQAWGYLKGAVENAIGRAPTQAELHRFLGKARDVAASNPEVTRTTTTTMKDGSGQNSTQSTTGGIREGDLALAASNMAATPEAAAYQVAGKYMNVLMGALDGPVDIPTPGGP